MFLQGIKSEAGFSPPIARGAGTIHFTTTKMVSKVECCPARSESRFSRKSSLHAHLRTSIADLYRKPQRVAIKYLKKDLIKGFQRALIEDVERSSIRDFKGLQ